MHTGVQVQRLGGVVEVRKGGVEEVVAGVRGTRHLQDGHEGRRLAAVTDANTAYMRRALRLASRAAGRTSPNPLVGSVVVRDATTVDGRVAVPGRRYLSGKPALREVHRLRDRTDAVLVGIGTVLADDPALTVREVKGRDPLRVIVDADARTPPAAKVVRAKDPQRTVIFVARDAEVRRTNRLREAGVLLVTAPRADGGLDLGAVLRWLGEHGVNTVMSEAGPHVAGALVRGGLADRVLLLFSPVAGGDGPPALESVPKASDLHDVRVRRLGNDLALEGALG